MPTAVDPLAWQPRPDVWLVVVVLVGGYAYLAATRGRRVAGPHRTATSVGQRFRFGLGVATLWLATASPIDVIGDGSLLSVHMVQFLLLTLVAPPLLLLGAPAWLLRALLARPWVRRLVTAATKPLMALVVFNAVIVVSHWPALVDLYLRSDLAHLAMHVVWVGAALAWWWPVLSPLPELPHLPYPQAMGYLFLQSFVPTIPASFLTFGGTPLYASYAAAPRLWGLSAIEDQQMAGLLMKIGGGLIIWAAIACLFARWAYEEHHGAPDWLYWQGLQPAVPDPDLDCDPAGQRR